MIVPDELARAGAAARDAFDDAIPLLTPREAKASSSTTWSSSSRRSIADRDQGLRELYVALTRPTTTLVVVHARPLPAALQLS